MNRTKCTACGLVNFASRETCRRCGADLPIGHPELQAYSGPGSEGRGVGRWLLWLVMVTLSIRTYLKSAAIECFSSEG
jgi:hypothetical protein